METLLHIRWDHQHHESWSKILSKKDKLISKEISKVSQKVHYHCIVKGNGESIRRSWLRTKHYMDYKKDHNRDNSYAIQKVKDESKMVGYVTKDGEVVENSMKYNLEDYKWEEKQEYIKKQKVKNYVQSVSQFILEEYGLEAYQIGLHNLDTYIVEFYIEQGKTIPGRYQIEAMARTLYTQSNYEENKTKQNRKRLAEKIIESWSIS